MEVADRRAIRCREGEMQILRRRPTVGDEREVAQAPLNMTRSSRRGPGRSPVWRTVLNVGAGTGSYEPPHCAVTAVEPSEVMIAQRPPGAAAVRAAGAWEAELSSKLGEGEAQSRSR
jgi:hypothetical protein